MKIETVKTTLLSTEDQIGINVSVFADGSAHIEPVDGTGDFPLTADNIDFIYELSQLAAEFGDSE